MGRNKQIFFVKFVTLSLLAVIVGLTIAYPANLAILAQLGLMILFQMPLHELAHYMVAKWFYDENEAAEIRRLQESRTEAESEFVDKYLVPRFGFNAFYGIESLKIIPAIFIQELNYTGKQFAFITLAGPIVDFSLATIYITLGLVLGPMTLLGFFSTQTMLHFGVLTILTWTGAFALKKLDLGQFRYSRVKRNAYNRFLVGLWYLGEAVLDEQGQLILDKQPGQTVGRQSRLYYLFEKLKNGTISKIELDLLIEAVIAANPPQARLARVGRLLQRLNIDKTLTDSQLTELETEIGNVEKALKVHKIVARMNDPVYFGLDLVATGHGVNSSAFEVQNLLGKMKGKLGASHEVPYFVAGGKLIFIMESSLIMPGGMAALQTSREFGNYIHVREVRQERQAFKGRKTIQVGIAKMQAPAGTDYSRELAHAEVLWDMIKGGGVA
ncbi:MAG: hypothetical protein KAR13_03575 [Desulfobulbaceae bacterium]|nr:hypothetical protein [Desulfobulbaceae bacterium]